MVKISLRETTGKGVKRGARTGKIYIIPSKGNVPPGGSTTLVGEKALTVNQFVGRCFLKHEHGHRQDKEHRNKRSYRLG